MKKTYVLDTSVLIDDPFAPIVLHDQENKIIIHTTVLEELDRLKTEQDYRGEAARVAIHNIDKLPLENGYSFEKNIYDTPYSPKIDDNHIINCAYSLAQGNKNVVLVSQDISMRNKARAIGLEAQEYLNDKVQEKYTGVIHIQEDIGLYKESVIDAPEQYNLLENQFVVNGNIIGRVKNHAIHRINTKDNYNCYGVKPKNLEQTLAMDLLLDDDIKLVALTGAAGTGKTLCAVASGLYKILREKTYIRLLGLKANIPIGKDIGFLPGSKSEKLEPWMASFSDNIDQLVQGAKKAEGLTDADIEERVIMEAITYIRGRSIADSWIIVDEAQNLRKENLRTIITRASYGTKIILLGDMSQIDSWYLNSDNNGLAHVIDKFKGQKIFGTVELTKCERSQLSKLAAELL